MSQACRHTTQVGRGRVFVALWVVLAVSGCDPPFSNAPPRPEALPSKASPTIRYQSYARLFVPNLQVGALAALPDRLLATTVGTGQEKLVAIDASGRVVPLGVRLVAPPDAVCQLALSPGHHPAFPEGDVLVSVGPQVCRVHLDTGAVTTLASLPVEDGDVAGLCFDPLGGFEYSPIVLAQNGGVYRVAASGALLRVGSVGPGGRGPSIASIYFGPYAGQLLVAFPASGDVFALSPTGQTTRVTGWSGVSGAYAVPDAPRALAGSEAALFVATRNGDTGRIYESSLDDIAHHPGALLLTSLLASGSGLIAMQYGTMAVYSWSRFMGAEVAATFVQRPAVTRVVVDVRPGAADEFFLGSTEPVAVALLSSPAVTPSAIDASTVLMAGATALPSPKGTPGLDTDVNDDGTPDLVLFFQASAMELVPGPMTLALTGVTFDGARLRGDAHVQVLLP